MSFFLGLRNNVAQCFGVDENPTSAFEKAHSAEGMQPGIIFAPLKSIDGNTIRNIACMPKITSEAVDVMSEDALNAKALPGDDYVAFDQSPAAQEMLDNLRKERSRLTPEQRASEGMLEPDSFHNRPNSSPSPPPLRQPTKAPTTTDPLVQARFCQVSPGCEVNPVLEYVIRTILKDRPDFAPLFREAYDAQRHYSDYSNRATILITSRATGEIELAFKEVYSDGPEPGLVQLNLDEASPPSTQTRPYTKKSSVSQASTKRAPVPQASNKKAPAPGASQDLPNYPCQGHAGRIPLECPKPQRYTTAIQARV